jgi:hypothetical protein
MEGSSVNRTSTFWGSLKNLDLNCSLCSFMTVLPLCLLIATGACFEYHKKKESIIVIKIFVIIISI